MLISSDIDEGQLQWTIMMGRPWVAEEIPRLWAKTSSPRYQLVASVLGRYLSNLAHCSSKLINPHYSELPFIIRLLGFCHPSLQAFGSDKSEVLAIMCGAEALVVRWASSILSISTAVRSAAHPSNDVSAFLWFSRRTQDRSTLKSVGYGVDIRTRFDQHCNLQRMSMVDRFIKYRRICPFVQASSASDNVSLDEIDCLERVRFLVIVTVPMERVLP